MRQKLYIPACLESIKTAKPKKESAAQRAARISLNKKLEDAAREIEALGRSVPNWKQALSSAAEKVRAKKIEEWTP